MSDDSLDEQLDKLEEAAQSGDQQHPIIRFLPIIVPLVALMILVPAGLIFFSFSDDEPEIQIQTVILSPEGMIKIDPAEPGGVEIPDRDKMVYDPMKQGSGNGSDAQVLPPPEAPMTPPEGGADLAAMIPPPPGTVEPILPPPPGAQGEGGMAAAPQLPPPPGGETAIVPPPGGETAIVPPPAAPPKAPSTDVATKTPETMAATPKHVPAAASPKATVPSGTATSTRVVSTTQTASLGQNYRVQIQSLNSQSQAEKAWEGWVKKHPDLFAGLSLTVQRAVIKDRGTYYRVQAGPFADHRKADVVCRALKKRGQDCLVVRP